MRENVMVRVLLLEDNPSMLAMLAQVLEWGGYEVITGRDGLEGIEILQTIDSLPAIIISDWSMPEMDGFELVHHIRTTPEWEHIPCVIMSAHSSPDDRRKALEQGADEFLEKPFNLEDFQQVLQRWEFTG
jgi:CheY-like chemotaxis protein